jgi:hypothetical protein
MRAQERKLRNMNLTMNKQDEQLLKKRGDGGTKTKKCSSSTRPKSACALIGLLSTAAAAKVAVEGDEIDANNVTDRISTSIPGEWSSRESLSSSMLSP